MEWSRVAAAAKSERGSRIKEAEMQLHEDLAHRLMWVMWPAFLVAGVAEMIFFTMFDPFEDRKSVV